MPEIIQQPICLSGQLSPAHPSFCMDGATHLIHTSIVGALRLLASNAAVKNALDMYENTNQMVTVCGYVKRSTNCSHIEVYDVQPSQDYIASKTPTSIVTAHQPIIHENFSERATFGHRNKSDLYKDIKACLEDIFTEEGTQLKSSAQTQNSKKVSRSRIKRDLRKCLRKALKLKKGQELILRKKPSDAPYDLERAKWKSRVEDQITPCMRSKGYTVILTKNWGKYINKSFQKFLNDFVDNEIR